MKKYGTAGSMTRKEIHSEIRLRKDLQEAQHIRAVITAIAKRHA